MTEKIKTTVTYYPDTGRMDIENLELTKFITSIIEERDFYAGMTKSFCDVAMQMAEKIAKFSGQRVTFMKDDRGGGFVRVDPPEEPDDTH